MKYQFVGQCTLCCLVGWLVVLGLMALSVSISVYIMSVFFHLQKSQTQYFFFFFFFLKIPFFFFFFFENSFKTERIQLGNIIECPY